jgi:hypothetical protein
MNGDKAVTASCDAATSIASGEVGWLNRGCEAAVQPLILMSRFRLLIIFGTVILAGVIVLLCVPKSNPRAKVQLEFQGYHTDSNGLQVARFALTNGNTFPITCFFMASDTNRPYVNSTTKFHRNLKIAAHSKAEFEGMALRAKKIDLVHEGMEQNGPVEPWILHVGFQDGRGMTKLQKGRGSLAVFLLRLKMERLAEWVLPVTVGTFESEVIQPPR